MWSHYLNRRPAGEAIAAAHGTPRTRRTHRLLALVFMATVAANFAVMPFGVSPAWLTYAPLPPLFVLMATGLVMFVAGRRRRRPGASNGPATAA